MNAQDPPERPGWELTFHDEFDGPKLNDWYWYPAYRSGRKIYFKQHNIKSRWQDLAVNYVIEDGVLKLRLDENLPARSKRDEKCVSSIQTSDHRFGETTKEYQVMDKFAQKYGWFEIRSRMPKGAGLHSAFWLLHSGPNDQEYTPEGRRRQVGEGVVEIDIFEQPGATVEQQINEFNVHFTKNGHYRCPMGFDPSLDFHVYALEWNEGELIWYIDGKKVHTYTGETPQKKMFILLGLYQGIFGAADPNMPYPRDFEIDYIRVYSRK
jgi:beta-glucanase (GH16 family)